MPSRVTLLAGSFPASLVVGFLLAFPLISSAASDPAAPKPPLAYTGGTPEVSETTATLRGGVDPRGTETSYFFQYGTSVGYGSQTPSAAAGAGTQEIKADQTVTGLTANTTYHYRLVATSAAGTTFGQDRVLTTKKTPLKIVIAAKPRPDVFGGPFSISGTLSGSESANHAVVLQANPFPYLNGFKDVEAPEITDSAGNFSFTYLGLSENTEFRVAALAGPSGPTAAPSVTSPGLIELLAVRATLHVHATARSGFIKFDGSVAPAPSDAVVVIQWLRPGHKPKAVAKTTLKRSGSLLSRYSTVVRIPHNGRYRAFVLILSGKQVSHYSRATRIR